VARCAVQLYDFAKIESRLIMGDCGVPSVVTQLFVCVVEPL
jgi:hypothetical protein